MNYGEKVRYARKKAGKTAGQLADYLGVSQPMVSKVENGVSEFSADNVRKMSEFLNVPIEFFIDSNAVSLDEYKLNDKAKKILADSNSVNYIVLADKAKAADITPAELEKAIDFLIQIKKQSS